MSDYDHDGEEAFTDEELGVKCEHSKIVWAADGVSGWCKKCGAEIAPALRSLPPQSD